MHLFYSLIKPFFLLPFYKNKNQVLIILVDFHIISRSMHLFDSTIVFLFDNWFLVFCRLDLRFDLFWFLCIVELVIDAFVVVFDKN